LPNQPFVIQQTFRADLNAEELVHKRIAACNNAFESGIMNNIKFSVIALENCLLGASIVNKEFLNDLQELETAWESRYKKRLDAFKRKMQGCVAPQLMLRKKPKHEPDFQHWRLKFIRLIDLCHERNMWFKVSKKMKY
jgi:hypothetical protein